MKIHRHVCFLKNQKPEMATGRNGEKLPAVFASSERSSRHSISEALKRCRELYGKEIEYMLAKDAPSWVLNLLEKSEFDLLDMR